MKRSDNSPLAIAEYSNKVIFGQLSWHSATCCQGQKEPPLEGGSRGDFLFNKLLANEQLQRSLLRPGSRAGNSESAGPGGTGF